MANIELTCIVDDDPVFVFGAKRNMEIMNFCNDIVVFVNGKDALDGIRNLIEQGKTPTVVFLDINMPVMDGWQFLDEFTQQEVPKKMFIYIVTSSIDPDDEQRARRYSEIQNFCVKPITPGMLRKIIEEVEDSVV